MRKIHIAAAIAAALTATIGMAHESDNQSFTHDGYTYFYTAKDAGKATVLTGRRLPGGETFRLRVRGNRVTGHTGQQAVSFRVSDAKGASAL